MLLDTWIINEIAATTKPSKTKLQAGQGKLKLKRLKKPQF